MNYSSSEHFCVMYNTLELELVIRLIERAIDSSVQLSSILFEINRLLQALTSIAAYFVFPCHSSSLIWWLSFLLLEGNFYLDVNVRQEQEMPSLDKGKDCSWVMPWSSQGRGGMSSTVSDGAGETKSGENGDEHMAESRLIAAADNVELPVHFMEVLSKVSVDGQNLLAFPGHKALEVDLVFVFRSFNEQVLQVQVDSTGSDHLDACPILLRCKVFVEPKQIAGY